MKVGDLVTLSASGKKLKMLSHIQRDDTGLVYESSAFFRVTWCKSGHKANKTRLVRSDIKHAKKTFSSR